MQKKRFLFLLIILLFDLHLIANDIEISNKDSILKQDNISSVDYLLNIAKETPIQDFNSAESILIAANHLADSLKDSKNQVNALLLLGKLYFDNGYFENAEEILNQVLTDFRSDLSDEQYAHLKHILGLNHIKFNNYDKAINFIQEALLYYEQQNNKAEIARALKDIGGIYYYLGNKNLALENFQKSLFIYQELNDQKGIARSYNNIGLIFKENGNTTLALEYLNQALKIKKKQHDQYGIANTLGNIGDAYVSAKEYDKAIAYFNDALDLWIELNYLHGATEAYNYLGDVYIKKQEFKKAIENLLKGQQISLKNNFKQRLMLNYQLLSEAYFQTKEYKQSIQCFRQYNILKDSVYVVLMNQKIEESVTKYENIKAEKELADQDKKIIIQRYQIIITLIALFCVVIFLLMLIRQNKLIRQKSKKIQNINKELDLRVNKRTSELRMSQFSIDIAADAIFWMNNKGKFIYVNNSACAMLDYSKEELIGMSVFDIVPEFSKDVWIEYWEQLRKKRSYVMQLYYKTRMGNEIPVEAAFNFREFEGTEFNFVFSRNLEERKVYEKKLKNAKEKAERSDKLKSAFLANMSHEIRTPMNAIVGFINLLGDEDITQDQKHEIIDLAQSSSNDLLNILNDIIDISKIEADELTVNKSLNYVNQLINDIYKFYEKDANYVLKEKLQLKVILEPNSDRIAIFTDHSRFKQVMNNLINNAIKFTEAGEIVIGYTKVNQANRKLLRFYVKDCGIGIPHEKLNIIFDRFNHLSDDRRKLFPGTGLGLAISKKLIELLGGQIGVISTEGQGSEFYFTLPYQIVDHSNCLEEINPQKTTKIDWSHKTILIVEDTSSNYFLLESLLKQTRINLIWAKSGTEAIEIFKQEAKLDLVLMDIQLPGINGYEATKLIKAYNKDVPVIAQTAYALSGEKEYSIREGCDDYISKPIKKEILFEVLSRYLS